MKHHYKKHVLISIFLLSISVIVPGCFDIISVTQASQVEAKSIFTSRIKIHLKCTQDLKNARLIFAFLVPRKLETVHKARISYSSTIGNGAMDKMEDTHELIRKGKSWPYYLKNKYGNGNNISNEMVWVVYQTVEKYSVSEGDEDILGTIFLSYNVGTENLSFKSSYLIANDVDGFSANNTVYHSSTVTVRNRKGRTHNHNYYTPKLLEISPAGFGGPRDILIKLDLNAEANKLMRSNIIFLRSTGYTKSNKTIKKSKRDASTKMIPLGNNCWRIVIDPAKHLKCKNGELGRMVFSFVNGQNQILSQNLLNRPFVYKF